MCCGVCGSARVLEERLPIGVLPRGPSSSFSSRSRHSGPLPAEAPIGLLQQQPQLRGAGAAAAAAPAVGHTDQNLMVTHFVAIWNPPHLPPHLLIKS